MDPAADGLTLLHAELLAWYRRHRRRLPWRTTRDPWRILVSEVMLQQTQAARVAAAYPGFCARFPTPAALAAAPLADVLVAWRGLGYNRRALHLHRAAQRIVADHAGRVPVELDALQRLPGIGAYTARAVRAFAFGRDEAPVDVNVRRVLCRAVAGRPLGGAGLQGLADGLVPAGRARAWAAALMDLGATHCTAGAPRCGGCPLAVRCAWRAAGGHDPAPATRRPAPFHGSARYHRGRLVDALRAGPLDPGGLAAAADAPRELAARLAHTLVDEGLAQWRAGRLVLPED